MTDEQVVRDARDYEAWMALDEGIRRYQAIVNPEQAVEGWVLVSKKLDMDDGHPVAGVLAAPGQDWFTTRGLLEIATDAEKDRQLVATIDDRIRRIASGDEPS